METLLCGAVVMHDTAYEIGRAFLSTYATKAHRIVVEVGAMDFNGSLRDACPESAIYLGLDVEHGKGVDILTKLKEPLPIKDGFADLLITTSQMEHDPQFWNTFLEFCRVVKQGGFIYMSAPSNGSYHRYPVDVWRFYPDAGHALVQWANDSGYPLVLVESFVAARKNDIWNDFVAVFHMGEWHGDDGTRYLSDRFACRNVWRHGESVIRHPGDATEDASIMQIYLDELASLRLQLAASREETASLREELQQLHAGMAAVHEQRGQARPNEQVERAAAALASS